MEIPQIQCVVLNLAFVFGTKLTFADFCFQDDNVCLLIGLRRQFFCGVGRADIEENPPIGGVRPIDNKMSSTTCMIITETRLLI